MPSFSYLSDEEMFEIADYVNTSLNPAGGHPEGS